MGWAIALAVLTALALIPVGIRVCYGQGTLSLRIRVGFLSFSLPKLGKKKEEPEPEAKPAEPKQPSPAPEQKAGKRPLSDYQPFLRLALDFLGSLRQKLRIDRLEAKLILAGEDPCDLATLYGCTWAGVSNLMASLNRLFVIRHQDVNVECDFTAEKTVFSGRLDLTLTVGRIVCLGIGYGIRALRTLLIFKKRKGGAAL